MADITDEEFYQILDRYLAGESPSSEEQRILEFYQRNIDKTEGGIAEWAEARRVMAKAHMKESIWGEVKRESLATGRRSFGWIRVAASIVLAVTIGFLFYQSNNSTPEVEIITKSVPRGQKLTITLPDGSIVKLNSESTLSFPSEFSPDKREISLTGEAFFEVYRNPEKPFLVSTAGLETRVLGTSFNVQAYAEKDEISVTVATGKVRVSGYSNKTELSPTEQAIYYRENQRLEKRSVDLATFLAWKDGIIHFDDLELQRATDILERWYDVTIDFENPGLRGCHITNTYDNESLRNILESISFINKVEYKFITPARVLIIGNACE